MNGLAPLPFTPSYEFENFNTFEDPFSSYSARPAYDVPADSTEPFNEESPSQELDNKLLSFSAPIPRAQIIDGAGILTDANMTAELYGMFFVAEDVFGGDSAGRPLELTCYRRNLWQCSGQITLPRNISHIIDEQSQQVQIFDIIASITAIESIEGKATEIISIPWKSAGDEGSKSPAAPPNIAVDLSTGQELDHNRVSLPVSWKRLQFKHATANNGRRKGLQQHYVVQISLLGKAKSGEYFKLADIQSGPVIVRGRSPRNFDSRKDVPLSGDKKAERRATMTPSDTTPAPKVERTGDLAQNIQKYHALGNAQVSSHNILGIVSSRRGSRLILVTAVWRLGIPPSVRSARAVVCQEACTFTEPQPTTRAAVVLGTIHFQAGAADNATEQLLPARRALELAHQPVPLRGRAQPQPLQLGLHVTAPREVDGGRPEPAEEPRGRRGTAIRVFPPEPRRLVGSDPALRFLMPVAQPPPPK